MDPYIYVFNTSGCHGHYLTYLIDRLSNNTPTITELPFNNLGTSHKKLNYSGYVKFIDTLQHKDNAHLKNTHVIKITGDDVLYYERVAMNRAEDAQRDLHTLHKDISFLKTYSKNFYENIVKTYKVKNNTVPKWVLRDAWKLGFLDLENQGAVKDLKADVDWVTKTLKKNTIHLFPVTNFFTTEKLHEALTSLNDMLYLNLNLDRLSEIHTEFMQKNEILATHSHVFEILDAVDKRMPFVNINQLDIIQQAYVYAELEKSFDFVVMPMTNDFFRTSGEIIEYIDNYPEHYKAMNPNLPKFNNIDNPFFLHRQKTKSVL